MRLLPAAALGAVGVATICAIVIPAAGATRETAAAP
jgi:hypothetical protein